MLKTCFRVVNFFSTGEVFIINQHHGPLLIEEIPPLGAPGVMLDSSDDDDDSVESSDEESEGDDDDSLVNNFIDYGDGDVLNALIAYPQAEVTEEKLGNMPDDEFEMEFYRNTLEASTRICIRDAVVEKSGDVAVFLEQKIIEALEKYNHQSSGFLMSQLAVEGENLIQAIYRKPDWILIKEENWGTLLGEEATLYKIRCDLQDFGSFSVDIEAKDFNLGSPGSLVHTLCCQVSWRLVFEYLHSTCCTHPRNICVKRCDIENLPNWAATAAWKTQELEIPTSVRSQLLATMHWLFWSKAFF